MSPGKGPEHTHLQEAFGALKGHKNGRLSRKATGVWEKAERHLALLSRGMASREGLHCKARHLVEALPSGKL